MKKETLTVPALEALLQAPSLAILAVDKQGCVILWSPSASIMFGWTESEVLGRLLPIVPEDERQVVYDRIQNQLKGEDAIACEVRRLRKDGSLVDISFWTTPLRDSKGEVIGVLCLCADISARKRAEGALRQSEAELQRVLAAVSDYLYSGEFDSDGRFFYHYYSPAVEQIMGRSPLFFLAGPERWLSAVHPEDRPRLAQAFARLQTGQSTSEEEDYRIVLPDHTIRWVRDSVTLSQGTDGRRFVNGVVSDITARKQTEDALRESELELRRVLGAASDYFWSGDIGPEGRFRYRYYSPSVERITGRPAEFYMAGSERWLSTVHPEDRARLAEISERQLSGQLVSCENEHRIVLPDGTIRWVRAKVTVSPSADGHHRVDGVVSDITARKQSEETLRESEARFRGIFTAAGSGIVLVSPEGRFLHANPAFCEFLGYSEQELLSKRVQDVTHPDDRERTAEIRRGMWEGEKSLIRSYEKRYLCKDGKTVWGEVSISLIRDAMGIANYSITQVLDITERKRTEMALRESEERYRLMAEAIPQPAWRTNAQGETTECNGRWYEYTGQTPEEARGNGWMKALHPDDAGRVMQKVQDDVAGGERFQVEYRLRRALDGSYRWHVARGLPIKDKDGRIVCWFGSAADIDDQKRAQERLEEHVRERTAELARSNMALRNSEAKYRTLVEEIPAITYAATLDEASTTLYVSPQVQTVLGLRPADYSANPNAWRRHVHPDDLDRVIAEVRRAHTSGEPLDCEYRLLNRTGGIVWIRDKAVVVRDEAGQPLFLQGVILDVTERHQAEETMQLQSTALQAADNSIVITDREGLVLWANPAFTKLTGYELSEVIGKDLRVLRSGQHDKAFYQNLWQTPLSGQVWHGEIVNKRKDGSLYTEEMTIAPVRDAAGEIAHFIAIKQDVTERKTAEEAQARLAAIVESSDDAIVSSKLDGTLTSWNAGAQRLYKYSPEEMLGRRISILIPRNRRGEAEEFRRKVLCGEHIQHLETVRLTKAGFPVDVAVTVSPLKNAAGQVIGVSAITHDITERKRAQEALRRSEAQYRALVETTGTGFLILDQAGRVLDANAEYVRLTGHRDLDEIRGRSVVEWTAGANKERNAKAVRTCLKNGYVRNLEIGYVDSHGKVTPVEVNATVDKIRGRLRIVALCRDITERKELEQAIVEASSREQRRIGLDLHDGLCQQLTGIGFLWKAITQTAAMRALPKAAEVAEISQLITKTIGEARDLARGLCPVELESNDLGVALKNLSLSMERLFAVSCVVRCQQSVLLADKTVATHLYRIAQEAISNAIRHGKAARVWIHLVWKKNRLTLRIRDNGKGFTKRRGFKEGIGMRSMKYRAQVIGGSLTIESKRGTGTTLVCVYTQPGQRIAGKARRHTPG